MNKFLTTVPAFIFVFILLITGCGDSKSEKPNSNDTYGSVENSSEYNDVAEIEDEMDFAENMQTDERADSEQNWHDFNSDKNESDEESSDRVNIEELERDDDAAPFENPEVQIVEPANGAKVQNPVTFKIYAKNVASVQITAEDNYPLSEKWNPTNSDKIEYTFSGVNVSRSITLTGYDEDENAVASHKISFTPIECEKGTDCNPFKIDSFPFEDSRDTNNAPQKKLNNYSCSPSFNEAGGEFIYVFKAKTDGVIYASVRDEGDETDIDIYLLSGMNPADCIYRHDKNLIRSVEAEKEYFLILDTYVKDGTEQAGEYDLKVDFITIDKSRNFSDHIVEMKDLLMGEDKGLGYRNSGSGHHTRDLYYDDSQVFTMSPENRTTHCVGVTYQIFFMALSHYYETTSDASVWNMPLSLVKSWYPIKDCWYVNSGCKGARDVLSKYGLGENVEDISALQPGDLVNYDRTSGSGHSVIFLYFLDKNGRGQLQYDEGVEGFRYVSSQGSTNGIDEKNAFFSGTCPPDVKNKDCGIMKSSMIMGRTFAPESFIPQSDLIFRGIYFPEEKSLPTIPANYDNRNH